MVLYQGLPKKVVLGLYPGIWCDNFTSSL